MDTDIVIKPIRPHVWLKRRLHIMILDYGRTKS